MTRQEANIKIAEKLLEICKSEDSKHLRFHQILFNLGINEFSEGTKNDMNKMSFNSSVTTFKDKYNEESSLTLKNMKC